MKLRVNEIYLPLDYTKKDVIMSISKRLGIKADEILSAKISKKSIDARKKYEVKYVTSFDIEIKNGYKNNDKKTNEIKDFTYNVVKCKSPEKRPVVIGFGPAGMFSALVMAQSGLNPIVLERGSCVEQRQKETEDFFKNRILNKESNVQFGEGGAGTFSDGKLNTGTKDVRIKKVLEEFVLAGAPREILYLAKPHLGTDNLPKIVKNIREKIISLGGEIHFNTKMTEIVTLGNKIKMVKAVSPTGEMEFETDEVILAIGHSARDTFKNLHKANIAMEQKAFSLGFRIEHKAKMINKAQYGNFHGKLPSADYKLFTHLKNGRGVYTFCMCPGGYVVAATNEENMVVTNGMSPYARDGENSNSAVLVGVNEKDFGSTHVLAGMHFQERIEKKAFEMAGRNYNAISQRFEDFKKNRATKRLGDIKPTYEPGVSFCNFQKLFPDFINESLVQGIDQLGNRLIGFNNADALLTGPETRSSSPIRILRGENFASPTLQGLYPCGEGAGYAGGITSAGVDGIKCAEMIIEKYKQV